MFWKKICLVFAAVPMVIKTAGRNLRHKKFEPEIALLEKMLKPGDVCLDIGGAYGRYAYPLSRCVGPAGKVICVEPGAFSFFVVSAIRWLFGMRNVVLAHCALGQSEREMVLVSPRKPNGRIGYSLSYLSDTPAPAAVCETVPVKTIDGLCAEHGIRRLDFIKCDTEGAEYSIFQGGMGTLSAFHPLVLCEIDPGHLQKFSASPQQLFGLFKGLGYQAMKAAGDRLNRVEDFSGDGNYFFIPGTFL
ncbi:MAG: FkbM family methyltransferase [Candidatus Omnitrophica bacterium]|nr:FkbM family methyltransferase [Candidatus Omnitrophota bacterium]